MSTRYTGSNPVLTTKQKIMNTYRFDYYAWIPGYNDFDQSDITIKADSEEKAWEEFNACVKFVKNASIQLVTNT